MTPAAKTPIHLSIVDSPGGFVVNVAARPVSLERLQDTRRSATNTWIAGRLSKLRNSELHFGPPEVMHRELQDRDRSWTSQDQLSGLLLEQAEEDSGGKVGMLRVLLNQGDDGPERRQQVSGVRRVGRYG